MEHGAAPRFRRMQPAQRRDQLITATLVLFTKRPHHQVTPEDVATESGVSRALFYRYFSSMEDLYVAALEVVTDGLIARLLPPRGVPTPDVARHAIHELFAFADEYTTPYIALLGRGHAVATPAAYALVERTRERVIDEILTRSGIGERSDYLVLTVRCWLSVLEGTVLVWVKRRAQPRDELERWLGGQLRAMLSESAEYDGAAARFLGELS